jgi:hypothetical protein
LSVTARVKWTARSSKTYKAGTEIVDISASRLSPGDPWAFRPTLTNGLVLSFTTEGSMFARNDYRKRVANYQQEFLCQNILCGKEQLPSSQFVRTMRISNYAINKKVAIIVTDQPVPFPAWR